MTWRTGTPVRSVSPKIRPTKTEKGRKERIIGRRATNPVTYYEPQYQTLLKAKSTSGCTGEPFP